MYIKNTKTITPDDLVLLNQLLDIMYEEATNNNDKKNSMRIESAKTNLIFK